MSGIFGIFHPNGRPVSPADLETMAARLAHRGGDRFGLHREEIVGLGAHLRWTTPEALGEKQPIVHPDKPFVLVADARIDNRAELIGRLGLDGPADTIRDSDLILHAYEKWGEKCPYYLLGDFAFALWDRRRQVLFCARDIFGVRPLYYFYAAGCFAFASEAKALLALPHVPRRLNELAVGHYLIPVLQDNRQTFYQDVHRLPPRTSMTVGRETSREFTYWEPDPYTENRLGSDEAYAAAFREIFEEAVRCRLRTIHPVGAELSGGLDSSSVTTTARGILEKEGRSPLHTFSAIHQEIAESDERAFILPVVDQGGLDFHFVDMDAVSPLVDSAQIFEIADETFTSPTIYHAWEICRRAQDAGVRVLLTGLDGDTTISHGYEQFIPLVQQARWQEFAQGVQALGHNPNLPDQWLLLEQYGFTHLRQLARSGRWLAFSRGADALAHHFSISRRYIYQEMGLRPAILDRLQQIAAWRPGRPGQSLEDPFFNPDFLRRISLAETLEDPDASGLPKSPRASHAQDLAMPIMPYIYEWANRCATFFGIDVRHPFADRRLVTFCLALPPEQKTRGPWTRWILRQGMDGILPQEVQWRSGKTVNAAAFRHSFLKYGGPLLEKLIADAAAPLAGYVDMTALEEIYNRYRMQEASDDEILRLWQALTLGLWLEHTALQP